MIDYIKMIILALFTGALAPLPTSSAAHFSFLNAVMNFLEDEKHLSFHFAIFSLVFSVVILISLRKIYHKGIKAVFSKKGMEDNYKKTMLGVLISMLLCGFLFIPVGEGKLLVDYFDTFLSQSSLLLTAFASIIGALILVISIWYTRQNIAATKRAADIKNVVRTSIYQLVAFVVPGLSHISIGATNMLISDVDSKVIIREIYVYLAPQIFLVSLVKVIRYAVSAVVLDPLMIIVGIVVCAAVSAVVVNVISKVNIRRLFVFFSIYSAVFGVFTAVLSFII